ncbi:CD44 antigen isoform X8 [Ochotona curzoniae]|uniref:CD44 antigen isoform X8 n=1 Tax=Ochotona curzoniae TaxID=130825 RepID=UPI001B348656|nr:CD44 antigen isoform X8 [Ochotona curzoniae]
MDKFWWRTAWGLCLVQLSLAQMHIDLNITCRFAGVFHVEKNGRYSISRTEAEDLCKAFNSSLPTMAQMEQALEKGFETCRYGFIQGHVVIPRINPNSICAANHTGVYILQSNTSQYDTYCFNASAPDGEDCSSVTDLPNSFDGPVTINIVNRDGTRYTKKGEYRTNPDDINRGNLSNNSSDEDVSSGFSVERNTPDATIFPTHLPTAHSTAESDTEYPLDHIPTTNRTDGTGGRRGGHFSADSTTSSEGYIPHYADTQENRTLMPVTPANTGAFGMTEVTVVGDSNLDLDRFLPGDQDSSVDPNRKYHTTHGSESAGHSNGSPDGGISTTSGPIRKPQIPEWLIILASLLALALILAVCIAVNSRRRCGQKKKLVINNGNGTVEDRKPSGLNGEASKSQEMVHLVNKESSETPDQFMTTDETQNLQNVNMKVEM